MFDDLGNAYAKAVTAFYDAGCRYLQFDDTIWAFLCSEKERAQSRQRGDNPDELPGKYAKMINHGAGRKARRHDDHDAYLPRQLPLHLDLGGRLRAGRRDAVRQLNYDGFFLEYDTERAGGFEPLRFVPKGNKQIVLGLVSSKLGALEPKDDLKRRIDEASKYVALDQLCLSPQCGFASTEEGNLLSEDEQWAKLRMIVEVANEVWGWTLAPRSGASVAKCVAPNRARSAGEVAMAPHPRRFARASPLHGETERRGGRKP